MTAARAIGTSEPPRLLSVEDNPETRLLLKHQLQEDYELEFASGVREALNVYGSEGPFDLLLIDINLGEEKSGTDLLHTLRDLETEEIPAVAVTAYAMPGDREHLLEKGFDGYVGKPFTRVELIETIADVLSET